MATVTRSSNSPSINLNSPLDPSLFPLTSIDDVVNFFKRSLELYHTHCVEPDLTLLSIVAGYIELSLTTGDAAQAALEQANGDVISNNSVPFPVVTFELVSGLYKKFQSILSIVDKPKISSTCNSRQATREVIKKVSDVIWHSLIRSSYKDRAHLQNLYTYLSGNKLDCFGVALAVVAGCQLLGYRDVRLAISEDHAWVVFGNKKVETIEITWHGKGSEDKRGQDIQAGVESGSWLYLGGLAVVCDKPMEVAAIASAINISISSNSDCAEVAEMQQRLLWLLYDMGHLRKYPMAIGTLGELEEINPTPKRASCDQLYREAIESAKAHYQNHHVYPYTYQGNYYNRLNKYREAFAAWANAGDVIRLYTYQCRDDEEIYKELLDIANEMIPYVMKTESSGHSARSILRDSEVFANLLRFYDGICQWEEDSLTPILHIGWAKPLVNNICKFDYDVRSQVVIKLPEDEPQAVQRANSSTTAAIECVGENEETLNEAKNNKLSDATSEGNNNLVKKDEKANDAKDSEMTTKLLANLTAACGEKILNPDLLLQGLRQGFNLTPPADTFATTLSSTSSSQDRSNLANNTRRTGFLFADEQQKHNNHHSVVNNKTSEDNKSTNGTVDKNKLTTNNHNSNDTSSLSAASSNNIKEENNYKSLTTAVGQSTNSTTTTIAQPTLIDDDDPLQYMFKSPVITLYSQKMKGLKDLLLAEKLNTHAISLQVTAQSVASRKVRGIDKLGNHTTNSTYSSVNVATASSADTSAAAVDSIAASRPKRTRRE
ncbi:menin [Stomoxys calcitrans]|uniref:menin n=1 Tax=Stomoxys calcitrans TaxID=35570 RepID=UPI0027E23CF3|nr:menin [Stomoxys calcitrans]